MERHPIAKIIFDRRKNSSNTKEGTVELEIYFQRKRKWISTRIKILPKHWHPQKYSGFRSISVSNA